jgi:hypothetical protein
MNGTPMTIGNKDAAFPGVLRHRSRRWAMYWALVALAVVPAGVSQADLRGW